MCSDPQVEVYWYVMVGEVNVFLRSHQIGMLECLVRKVTLSECIGRAWGRKRRGRDPFNCCVGLSNCYDKRFFYHSCGVFVCSFSYLHSEWKWEWVWVVEEGISMATVHPTSAISILMI